MRNTSETWKSLAAGDGTHVESRAIINNIEYSNIEPPTITRALMQNGLEVGNVVSAMCSFILDTVDVIPKSAEVQIASRLVGGTDDAPIYSEWLPQGTFYISKRVRDPLTGIRKFECYDALLKTNAVWEPASSAWPQQTEDILDEILLVIGLELDARTSITSYPISQPNAGTTMRDVLSIIAQQNGGNWIVTPDNKLRLVPIKDLNDAGEDVVEIESVIGEYYTGEINEISGIRVVSEDGDSLIGDETGAVVSVTIPEMIAADLAEELIGKTYRPFSFGNAGYDIAAELGDYIQCEDAVSVIYAETITLGTTMHGDISAPDLAEIADEYPYVGSSDKTLVAAKAYAKEYANNAIDGYDQDLTQQEIFNRLTDNGAAQGLVMYNGQLYVNASYINAGYLSAARIKGDKLTLGGANNVNGTMRILDASGNVIGTWSNNGISIFAGSIQMSRTDGDKAVTVSIQQSSNNPMVVEYDDDNTSKYYRTVLFGNQLQILDYVDSRVVSISPSSINLRENGVSTFEANANLKQYGISDVGSFYVKGQSSDTKNIIELRDRNDGFEYVAINAPLFLEKPLYVTQGGTGAQNAADARTNLEITPANIGALAASGGEMTGDIDMGQAGASSGTPSIKWRTADGTLFSIRPHGNTFQIVRGEGSSATSVLNVNSDGTLSVNPQANWRSALGVVPSRVNLSPPDQNAKVTIDWQSNVILSGVLFLNANVTVTSAISGNNVTILNLPSGCKSAWAANPFLSGRVNGATHQLYIGANGTSIITGFSATSIPAGPYVLSGVILLG